MLVVGPTGSGKSTLLRCINGLVPHFSGGTLHGRVVVDGRDTREHRPATWPTWSASSCRTRPPRSSPTRSRRRSPTAWRRSGSTRSPCAAVSRRRWTSLGLPTCATARCETSPAGSSSGWRSGRCWPQARGSSSWTSPPGARPGRGRGRPRHAAPARARPRHHRRRRRAPPRARHPPRRPGPPRRRRRSVRAARPGRRDGELADLPPGHRPRQGAALVPPPALDPGRAPPRRGRARRALGRTAGGGAGPCRAPRRTRSRGSRAWPSGVVV